MNIKKVRVKINQDELSKRIEKEINKEITIKVPIKGIKVEVGEVDNWSWWLGILIVLAMAMMGWRLSQNEKTIRRLIEEKNKIEMQSPVLIPTAVPTLMITSTPTLTPTPTPTINVRYRGR